jgi:hypothetical protein
LSLFTTDVQLTYTVSIIQATIPLRAVEIFDVLSAATVEEMVVVQFCPVLPTIVAAVRDANLDGKQLYRKNLLAMLW